MFVKYKLTPIKFPSNTTPKILNNFNEIAKIRNNYNHKLTDIFIKMPEIYEIFKSLFENEIIKDKINLLYNNFYNGIINLYYCYSLSSKYAIILANYLNRIIVTLLTSPPSNIIDILIMINNMYKNSILDNVKHADFNGQIISYLTKSITNFIKIIYSLDETKRIYNIDLSEINMREPSFIIHLVFILIDIMNIDPLKLIKEYAKYYENENVIKIINNTLNSLYIFAFLSTEIEFYLPIADSIIKQYKHDLTEFNKIMIFYCNQLNIYINNIYYSKINKEKLLDILNCLNIKEYSSWIINNLIPSNFEQKFMKEQSKNPKEFDIIITAFNELANKIPPQGFKVFMNIFNFYFMNHLTDTDQCMNTLCSTFINIQLKGLELMTREEYITEGEYKEAIKLYNFQIKNISYFTNIIALCEFITNKMTYPKILFTNKSVYMRSIIHSLLHNPNDCIRFKNLIFALTKQDKIHSAFLLNNVLSEKIYDMTSDKIVSREDLELQENKYNTPQENARFIKELAFISKLGKYTKGKRLEYIENMTREPKLILIEQ